MNNSSIVPIWNNTDKSWRKKRNGHWKEIKSALNYGASNIKGISTDRHKYHKEFFFEGTFYGEDIFIDGVIRSDIDFRFLRSQFGTTHWSLYLLWYHPQPDTVNLLKLLQANLIEMDYSGLLIHFFEGFKFSSIYDSVTNRNEFCVNLLFPKIELEELIIVQKNELHSEQVQVGLAARSKLIFFKCLSGTRLELTDDKKFHRAFHKGQYLWPHLSYLFEHNSSYFDKESIRLTKYKKLVAKIMTFDYKIAKYRKRDSTIAMVETLMKYYKEEKFSQSMMAFWKDVEDNLESVLEKTD